MSTPTQAEYDVIFAGAGTSGGVAAGRLAAADPSLKILLIESGPHVREDDSFVQPARCLSHLRADNPIIKVHVSNESEYLGGRSQVVTCAHVVGGGSSINFTMYNRAVASDFDDWENVFGNPGWGSKEIVPLLKKTETYQVAPGKDDIHGYTGPLKVSYGGKLTNIGKDFLDVAQKFDKTRPISEDPNGIFTSNVWIDGETGKRSDVAHHYIYNHPSIEILTGSLVKRVIFEGNRAVGVEYVPNPRFQPDSTAEVKSVRAKKLVVISAGTFGSPGILERSGIGAKDVLEKAGVKQFVDLPGVGENYQDHPTIFAPYLATKGSDTLDGIGRGEPEDVASKGLTSLPICLLNPSASSEWHAQWLKDGQGMMAHKYIGDPLSVPARKYFCMGYFPAYPASMGHVHIKSGDVADAPLDFETAYCKRPEDLAILKFGYKLSREFARRLPCYEGEYTPSHPVFDEASEALCKQDVKPVPVDAPRIKYTPDDDVALEDYLRKFVVTAWHFLGTCAMKRREMGGVVDNNLNIYGVEGLKVCVFPVPTSTS
ncbi:hypothetical protein PHLCEN_2v9292 [Hermanssonia centrifuga]|uniref:Glucose-methanol-choline oxidoreductase N-terminal domain-containing protein n=1 Tax=Hermanssonia centrifuga TaxID=98765 RepID=A0A2R6NRB8_9APHY|nr:hypothetical protein PHLCEN_2v9292 [Hermanssonia centrifuga]